jgi:hypothetical protein
VTVEPSIKEAKHHEIHVVFFCACLLLLQTLPLNAHRCCVAFIVRARASLSLLSPRLPFFPRCNALCLHYQLTHTKKKLEQITHKLVRKRKKKNPLGNQTNDQPAERKAVLMPSMQSSSTSAAPSPIDPYVLEFAVNFKWLLRYVTQHLDPTVEAHYPTLIADVANMENVLAHTTFEESCTLNDLPFGALRLSRESVVYLLVCDHLLGGCPPTMHPFLQRAYGGMHAGDGDGRAKAQRSSPTSMTRTPLLATSTRVVVFGEEHSSLQRDRDNNKGRTAAAGVTPLTHTLDGTPVGTLDGTGAPVTSGEEVSTEGKEAQAALLLLRWLFVEGVLSEEELSATLNLDHDEDDTLPTSSGGGGNALDSEEWRVFRRHQRLAHRLAELIPFYLGAHVLISRSVLLQYSATLLTADGVMQHVRRLQAPLMAHSNHGAHPSPCPPCSMEGALLEWFQAIMDSTRQQVCTKSAFSSSVRPLSCSALRHFTEHGPFCSDVLDPLERDFFRLVQSGECVCIALWFYCPDALPLAELSQALRDAELFMASHSAEAELYSTDAAAELFQRHQSQCYWTAIFAASRRLGVIPLLSPAEVVVFGRTALPLHLFVFVQQLFAVLATKAEEDVRVSADTAWWEQLGNPDGYTEFMQAKARGNDGDDDNADAETHLHTNTSSWTMSEALHVLRESMRDSFPPDAFRCAKEEPPYESMKEEIAQMGAKTTTTAVVGARATAAAPGLSVSTAVSKLHQRAAFSKGQRTPLRPPSLTDVATPTTFAVVVSNGSATREWPPLTKESLNMKDLALLKDAAGELRRRNASSNTGSRRSSSSASSTHFTMEFPRTQRSRGILPSSVGAVETATSVLRPMVQRGRQGGGDEERALTTAMDVLSYSATTSTSADNAWGKVSTEKDGRAGRLSYIAGSKVELAARVVDTYARFPEELPSPPLSLPAPDAIGVLMHPHDALVTMPLRTLQQPTQPGATTSTAPGNAHAYQDALPTAQSEGIASLTPPLPLEVEDKLVTSVMQCALEERQPSSPQLPGTHKGSASKRLSAFEHVEPTASLAAAAPSSTSSLTYSTDFVVQSAPYGASKVSLSDAAAAVDRSASFTVVAPLKAPPVDDELVVSASLLAPLPDQRNGAEAAVPLSSSAVAIKKFTALAEESVDDTTSSGTDSGKADLGEAAASPVEGNTQPKAASEKSSPTPSSLSSFPSPLSRPPSSPHRSPTKAIKPLQNSIHGGMLHERSGAPTLSLDALSSFPTDALAAVTAPTLHNAFITPATAAAVDGMNNSKNDNSSRNDSQVRPSTKTAAAPRSPSLTDIAVEDDGTLSALHQRTEGSSVGDSFPTPTEREEDNRRRTGTKSMTTAAAGGDVVRTEKDATSNDAPSPSQQQTPVRGNIPTVSAETSVLLPSVFSPSPVQPMKRNQLASRCSGTGRPELDRDTVLSHHTLSDDDESHVDGLSPLTPALTQSISAVYGTDCLSLLEGAANSYANLSQERRPRHWDEESWFSSASHPHRQSLQSTVGSLMSVDAARDFTHVSDLLTELGNTNAGDLELKNKEELRAALARQQELVRQLASALQQSARSRVSGARMFAPAVVRPSERTRQVRLRSPSEEIQGDASADRQRNAIRPLLAGLQRRSESGTAERSRQRSVSGMTVESQGSPSRSIHTDLGAQLAETDVSSLLADILLPAKSVSPTRTKPK